MKKESIKFIEWTGMHTSTYICAVLISFNEVFIAPFHSEFWSAAEWRHLMRERSTDTHGLFRLSKVLHFSNCAIISQIDEFIDFRLGSKQLDSSEETKDVGDFQ